MLQGDLKHPLSTNTHQPWRGVAIFAQHWMWLLTSWNQPGTRTPWTLCDGYKAKVSWRFWYCCAHLCHCLSTGESSSSGPSKKCFWQITLFSTFFTVTTTSAQTPECHLLVCHWWVLTFRHPSGELALIKSTQIRRSAFFMCFVLWRRILCMCLHMDLFKQSCIFLVSGGFKQSVHVVFSTDFWPRIGPSCYLPLSARPGKP